MPSVDAEPDPSPQQYWPCCQRSSSRCIPPLFVNMSRQIAMEMTGLGLFLVCSAGLRDHSGPKGRTKQESPKEGLLESSFCRPWCRKFLVMLRRRASQISDSSYNPHVRRIGCPVRVQFLKDLIGGLQSLGLSGFRPV